MALQLPVNDETLALENASDINIIVTGFMGTGKSTVGHLVAERLGRLFLDTDAVIEERVGKPIPQIFKQHGEPAFRALERQLVIELAQHRGLVVATGGGMLIDAANRALMLESGFVVCLDAPLHVLEMRLRRNDNRPLAVNWRELYQQRRAAYAAIPVHVDTNGRTPKQSADEIIRLWKEQRLE